jgi:hypothetical protein
MEETGNSNLCLSQGDWGVKPSFKYHHRGVSLMTNSLHHGFKLFDFDSMAANNIPDIPNGRRHILLMKEENMNRLADVWQGGVNDLGLGKPVFTFRRCCGVKMGHNAKDVFFCICDNVL